MCTDSIVHLEISQTPTVFALLLTSRLAIVPTNRVGGLHLSPLQKSDLQKAGPGSIPPHPEKVSGAILHLSVGCLCGLVSYK